MTPAEFIVSFSAFATEDPALIQRHITAAAPAFDVTRWGDDYSAGLGCYVAHSIITEKRDILETSSAAALSHDNSIQTKTTEAGASGVTRNAAMLEAFMRNPFLSTVYGQRYYKMARRIGAGGMAA